MKDESGFTLMETLCAIALFLVVAGAAGGLAYNTRRITDNVQQRSFKYFRQLRFEALVREAAENVSIPYWENEENALPLAREALAKALTKAGYNDGFTIETLKDNSGRIRGMRCFYFSDSHEYKGAGLFASIPLAREYK